jgi:hypothetical protein
MEAKNKAFWEACQSGNLEEAKTLRSTHPEILCCIRNFLPFRLALKSGHLPVVKWLQELFPSCVSSIQNKTLQAVIRLDNAIEILEWLDEMYIFKTPLEISPKTKLDVVKWIVKRFNTAPYKIMEITESLEVIKWLLQTFSKEKLKNGVHVACYKTYDLARIKLIYSVFPEFFDKYIVSELFRRLYEHGNVESAEWLVSTFGCDEKQMDDAFRTCATYCRKDDLFIWFKNKVTLSPQKIDQLYTDVVMYSKLELIIRFKTHFPGAKLGPMPWNILTGDVDRTKWILQNYPSLLSQKYINENLPQLAKHPANLPLIKFLTSYFDIGIDVMERCYNEHRHVSLYGPDSSYPGYPVVKWLRDVYDF